MTELRTLLDAAADAVPTTGVNRAERAVAAARRVRRTRVVAVVVAAVAAVLAGSVMVPLASRLGAIEPAGPGEETGLPDQIYPVPLHAPSVGEGAALGQPAALLLGGVPSADGWFRESCCHLAVVGASTDQYAFVDLPAMTDVAGGGALNARLAPDGRFIAYATTDGVRLLNLVDGSGRTLDAPQGWQVWSVVAWSRDGTRLAVATGDPAPGVAEEIGLATVTAADPLSWSVPDLGIRWDGSTTAVTLAPDGAQIALAQDGELRIGPVDGGSPRILLTGIGQVNPYVAWSPDGARIAALGFANRPDQGEAPEGSGAAWFKGRFVELADGKGGLFDTERGQRGWYSVPLAWTLRGLIDRLLGGVGLRRGRRDPDRLFVGESLDFWRVEEVQPGRLLRLRAEMRLPGLAWLELGVRSDGGRTIYTQRALFHPHGLLGHAYWWAISPFHRMVFGGMKRNIARAAEAGSRRGVGG